MMQQHRFNDKMDSLKKLKNGASPEHQLDIDFIMFGMVAAFYPHMRDEELHEERMDLLYSENPKDKRKGKAYRKGMDIVLYGKPGKKMEKGTTLLSILRVDNEINRGLNNIKEFLGIKTLAPVRKSALRWYIENMNEIHGKDFFE